MAGAIGDRQAGGTNVGDSRSWPEEAAAISFSSSASLDQELTTVYQDVKDAINDYSAGGTTDMTDGIETAEDELLNGTNATPGASKVMVLLSDGSPNDEVDAGDAADIAKDNIRIFTIALGSGADESFLADDIASSPDDAFVAPDPADLDTVYAEIAQIVLDGEQKIAEGTMAEVFAQLSEGKLLDGNRQEEGRQPYPGATTQCIGFEWTLPAEVGNEIQTDSVSFDLAVYAEQSRHNDNPQVAFNGTDVNSTSPGPAPNGTGNVSNSS